MRTSGTHAGSAAIAGVRPNHSAALSRTGHHHEHGRAGRFVEVGSQGEDKSRVMVVPEYGTADKCMPKRDAG